MSRTLYRSSPKRTVNLNKCHKFEPQKSRLYFKTCISDLFSHSSYVQRFRSFTGDLLKLTNIEIDKMCTFIL